MQKFRTHYDNLKVSRDAPIEVIQAAYRSLARKHHPDRTGGTPESEAIMKTINASYEVLSDPVERAKHDAWIDSETSRRGHRSAETHPTSRSGKPSEPREFNLGSIVTAVFYVVTALSLLRAPGLRIIGLGMLLIGSIIVYRRFR